MRVQKKYYIKQRTSLNGTYYVACGQLSKAAAKRRESSLFGINFMHAFDDEDSYKARIAELRAKGEHVQ